MTAAEAARAMMRTALKGALATRDSETGEPYASMVLIATAVDNAPLTLISSLARHTRNLVKDGAASLLIDMSDATGEQASGGRVSLMGRFRQCTSADTRVRFLARHPGAADYAAFSDFSFWRMDVSSAHLIEGFGRIVPLAGAAVTLADVSTFAAAEPALAATLRQKWPEVTGFDPEGVDVREKFRPVRYPFPHSEPDPHKAAEQATTTMTTQCSPL